jgi:hypothetical protein
MLCPLSENTRIQGKEDRGTDIGGQTKTPLKEIFLINLVS